MAYITREDGERFVIPSYRDVLIAKKVNLLRKEIHLLSSTYGDYITLQRKNVSQFEVTFSPDPGYLLGESVWNYFKRPNDLVYCEAIPNTTEAILVIVKAGSVYLDGVFAVDAIQDELLILRTQQNNFDIYVYGDVPISHKPESGKFSFAESSIKSFRVLEQPVFPTLPVNKMFQLQLVDVVLKSQSIRTLSLRPILLGIFAIALIWTAWIFIFSTKELPKAIIAETNPYESFNNQLASADPATQIHWLSEQVIILATIPGWTPDAINFNNNSLNTIVRSKGVHTESLFKWAEQHHATVDILSDGLYLTIQTHFANRNRPTTISNLNSIIATLIDSMSYIIPGNNIGLKQGVNKGRFSEREITIHFNTISARTLDLIGQQFKNLPLVLSAISINVNNGFLSGSITLKALGN